MHAFAHCIYEWRALLGSLDAAMVPPPRILAFRYLLGRSQVGRQRILISPFPGSNPCAPARIFHGRFVTLGLFVSLLPFHSERQSARHSEQMYSVCSQVDARGVSRLLTARDRTFPSHTLDKLARSYDRRGPEREIGRKSLNLRPQVLNELFE